MKRGATSYGKISSHDDDLDNILDVIEEKKGISTKLEPQRPKTTNQPLWSAARNNNNTGDDLDMLDD